MEFLDDLREQRETGKQSPRDSNVVEESDTPYVDPWEALLAEASFDEAGGSSPAVTSKREKRRRDKARSKQTRRGDAGKAKAGKARRKGARPGLSGGQKLLLGFLTVLVVGIWIGIGAVLSGALTLRGMGGAGGEGDPIPVDPGLVPLVDSDPAAATVTPTVAPLRVEVLVTATSYPTPSPVPPSIVSTVYDNQILQDPDNVDLYLKRGAAYLSLRVYPAALADYEVAIGLNDQLSESYIGLGWSQFYGFAWDAAEAAFATAIDLDEDASEAYFGLGLLYYYRGAYAEAAQGFDAAAEIDPLNAEAEAWMALAAARAGDVREAVDAVNRAMQITQNLPIVYVARSWSQRVQDPPNLEGAHGDLLYALGLAPNQFLTLNALAAFYADYRPDRLSEAEVRAIHAGEWAANPVEQALSLQTLGRVYLALDRKADAARVLTQAAELATVEGIVYLDGLQEDLLQAQQ